MVGIGRTSPDEADGTTLWSVSWSPQPIDADSSVGSVSGGALRVWVCRIDSDVYGIEIGSTWHILASCYLVCVQETGISLTGSWSDLGQQFDVSIRIFHVRTVLYDDWNLRHVIRFDSPVTTR